MVRRTDRPLGQVRVSFETTRFGPQLLIEAYDLAVPEVRQSCQRAPYKAALRETKTMKAKMRRGER